MKYCSKCGNEMRDFEKYCGACGGNPTSQIPEPVINNKKDARPQMSNTVIQNKSVATLCCPDEQIVASLGNGYGVNALYGDIKKTNVALTDKRIYFKGTLYEKGSKSLVKKECSKIVNLEDITGTGFTYSAFSLIGLLPYAIIMILCIVAAVIMFVENIEIGGVLSLFVSALTGVGGFLVEYYKSKFTLFNIEYAGGNICLDTHVWGLSHVSDFQQQIYRAKDRLKNV